MANPQQGDIYWLPRQEFADGDPKPERPHVMASVLSVDRDLATLIYCSTSSADAELNEAPHVRVEKNSSDYRRARFRDTTYVYPNRLAYDFVENLTDCAGSIHDYLPSVKQELARALGVAQTSNAPSSRGLRGRIAQFTDSFRARTDSWYGLIVTEPAYSLKRSFQTVIPIVDAEGYDEAGTRWVIGSGDWLAGLSLMRGVTSACFLVPVI